MSFIENIGSGIKGYFEKQKEEREFVEKLQKEAQIQRRQIFEEEFKKNAFEVSKITAKRDAEKKSGVLKLRAINRSERLNEPGTNEGTFFDKLRVYTQANIERRERNLGRTEKMRNAAKELMENKGNKTPSKVRKPFEPTRLRK